MLSSSEKALLTWFRQQGGRLEGAAIQHWDGLRGMYATRDIRNGDVVLSAPRDMVLTLDTVMHSPLGQRLRRAQLNGTNACIGTFLVEHLRQGGYWSPMLHAFPSSFSNLPSCFDRHDCDLLEGSAAKVLASGYWRLLRSAFRRVKAVLPPAQRISLRDFMWGYLSSVSRTFSLSIDGNSVTGMVPLADMFNHDLDPNCTWRGDHSDRFEIRAKRPIAAGSPLTISYGRVPNTRLLAQYGFCLEHNPHDTARVFMLVQRRHWLHGFAPALTGNSTMLEFHLGRDPGSADARRLMSCLRLLSLPSAEAASAHAGLVHGQVETVPVLDPLNEGIALRKLVNACERSLAALGGDVEADDELLNSGRLSARQRCAVTVRRGEKQILQEIIGVARHVRAAMCLPDGERRHTLADGMDTTMPWTAYLCELHGPVAADAWSMQVVA